MSTRATGVPGLGRVGLIGDGPPARRSVQELGRLTWLAALFSRAFFLRDFFAIADLLVMGRIRPAHDLGADAPTGGPASGPTR